MRRKRKSVVSVLIFKCFAPSSIVIVVVVVVVVVVASSRKVGTHHPLPPVFWH